MCSARPMCRIAATKEHVFKEARMEQNWPPAGLHTAAGTSPAPNAKSSSLESQELLERCQQEHTAGMEQRKGHHSSPGTGSIAAAPELGTDPAASSTF